MHKLLTFPLLSGHFTSRNPAQSINSYVWVSPKHPSVGSYQVWKDKTRTCYALRRSKGGLMTEMWLLLKRPERISWAAFLFSSRDPLKCLPETISSFSFRSLPLPSLPILPTAFRSSPLSGYLRSCGSPSVKQL